MMTWDEYVSRFTAGAAALGHDRDYVVQCLRYARHLHERKMPVIYDQDDLARQVGYQVEYVRGASSNSKRFYREFEIPKASGGHRLIREPLPSLKEIQRWILDNILAHVPVSRFAKAYQTGVSILDNARFHRRQNLVVRMDVKDFFPSISAKRIFQVFRSFGYTRSVSWTLTRLCTFRGSLPQGAPTSAALSNIVCHRLDRRLSGYCVRRKIRFTRYADDLTFSGDFGVGDLHWFARRVLQEEGLELNDAKTRVMRPHQRQLVTGIVVNSRKMQAPRELRRRLRQIVFFVEKHGVDGHLRHIAENRARYVHHVLGVANHILFINPGDRDALRAKELFSPFAADARRLRRVYVQA